MTGSGLPILYAVDCSECERPTITSGLCVRPDLCYPCFTELVTS
jgi:hypothetical protein